MHGTMNIKKNIRNLLYEICVSKCKLCPSDSYSYKISKYEYITAFGDNIWIPDRQNMI